jgi:hypothetical protein
MYKWAKERIRQWWLNQKIKALKKNKKIIIDVIVEIIEDNYNGVRDKMKNEIYNDILYNIKIDRSFYDF